MDQRINAAIRYLLCICLWMGMLSKGWAFTTQGDINADFSYRNLNLVQANGAYFLGGLIKNRSYQVQLGVVFLIRAADCARSRTLWKVRLYFESIDPQVEIPFTVPIEGRDPGFVCKFSFRTGYHILPVTSKALPQERPSPKAAPPSAQAPRDTDAGNVVYTWADTEGIIHYSILPPEPEDPPKKRRGPRPEQTGPNDLKTERIYAWIDPKGVTRYSDTPPEPRLLLEHARRARETYDNIEAYARALNQRVWRQWLPPEATWPQAGDRKVIVRFYILPDGRIRNIHFEKASGLDALDESFYNAVAKSDPLPPLPANFTEAYFNARIVFTPEGPE